MSQWAEVRHLHLVEGVPKKEIARRLKLDVKTVRRAIGRPTPPVRVSPQRVRSLDPWQKQIEEWLRDDRRLTAKRVRRLLLPLAGPVSQRTVRRYVAALKSEVKPKEAFVHRSALPGATMEVDFGETWVDLMPGHRARSSTWWRRCRTRTRTSPRRTRSSGSSRCSTASSPPSSISGAQRLVSSSITRRLRSRRSWPAGTGCRPKRSRRSGARIRSGPTSARRPRAGRKVRWREASNTHGIWCSGRGWRSTAGRRSTRRSSPSWRPTCRCATSTTGARRRKPWRWSGSICGRCPSIFPPPAASSRGWPTSSDTSAWTTSPTRCRSATPTGRCG